MKQVLKMSRKLCHPLLMAAIFAFVFAACGGGDDFKPITYTGNTSLAVIDETNAETMAGGAYEQTDMAGFLMMALLDGGSQGTAPAPVANSLAEAMITTVESSAESSSTSDVGIMAVTVGGSDTIEGSCGGSATLSGGLTYNDDGTGSGNISIQFRNLCGGGVTIAGGLSMTMTFTYTGDPKVGPVEYTSNNGNIKMNMVMKEGTTGKTYKVEGYDVTIKKGYDVIEYYEELTITGGTFYHHDHGYVSIHTTTPMRKYNYEPWHSSGVLVVSAGSRSVTINATSSSPDTCVLDYNDGSGSVAPYPMEVYWSSFGNSQSQVNRVN